VAGGLVPDQHEVNPVGGLAVDRGEVGWGVEGQAGRRRGDRRGGAGVEGGGDQAGE
jgi:hypothetical protein